MAKRSVSDIRTIAVVGHGSSGKTTLVEHLLHAAGAVNRAGSVDAGTSISDNDAEEQERKFSIESSIFAFQWEGKSFQLIDTPGYLEFSGAAAAAIAAAETALIVIHAGDGVRLNTRRTWEWAEKGGLAKALLITHLDADNLQFDRLMEDIRETFGNNCVPLFLPVGLGGDCTGIVNLLTADEAPDGVVGDFESLTESLKEAVIECDDDLMERYLEGEEIPVDQVRAAFKQAIISGQVVPILCCVPEKGIGVQETLQFLADCTPSPEEGPKRTAVGADDEEVEVPPDPDAPFCALVFKSVMDMHVGRLVYFKVLSGTLSAGASVQVARTGDTHRLGHFYSVFGGEQTEVPEAVPGDIICATKVEDVKINDTLRAEQFKVQLPPIEFPKPMTSLAVEPRSRDDEQKINSGLQRMAEGEPTIVLSRDRQSHELVVTGMSNLHLDVLLSKLKRRYGVSADTHEPSIPYLETITTTAEARYKHRKQTGGRGQYGEVHLRLEPNERGAGFEFIDEIKGGVIPQQYIPAVEKGIREILARGILAGFEVVDVKAAVFFGSFHPVDSSEAAFKIAGARAFAAAFERCRPVMLEPIAVAQVTIPAQYVGDVTGNLAGHRGRILGMDQVGRSQTLTAEIPMAEIRGYSAELQSMTGGEGTFTMELSHYEPVPSHVQQQIIAKHKKQEEEE